jgi:hypothetical protein
MQSAVAVAGAGTGPARLRPFWEIAVPFWHWAKAGLGGCAEENQKTVEWSAMPRAGEKLAAKLNWKGRPPREPGRVITGAVPPVRP